MQPGGVVRFHISRKERALESLRGLWIECAFELRISASWLDFRSFPRVEGALVRPAPSGARSLHRDVPWQAVESAGPRGGEQRLKPPKAHMVSAALALALLAGSPATHAPQ